MTSAKLCNEIAMFGYKCLIWYMIGYKFVQYCRSLILHDSTFSPSLVTDSVYVQCTLFNLICCRVDAKTLDLIERMCKSAGYLLLRLDGQTPTAHRMELVERFNCQSSPECKLTFYVALYKFAFSKAGLLLFDSDVDRCVNFSTACYCHVTIVAIA